MKIVYRAHALQRMMARKISRSEVRAVLREGSTIEEYPNRKPLPARLVLGWSGARPLHVAVGYDAATEIHYVISTYEPEPDRWEPDFKTRRKS